MFATLLKRSIAGCAAAGIVLSLTAFTAPVAITVAPARHVVACRGYQGTTKTTTSLSLARYIGHPGQRNAAHIHVRSGGGTPSGSVRLSVQGHGGQSMTLRHGSAGAALPSHLGGGHTYRITASYGGHGCFKGSAASAHYTVRRH